MLYVLLSYVYGIRKKIPKALDSLENGETKLNAFTDNSPDVVTYGQAFLHIITSMKAYWLLMRKNTSVAKLEVRYHLRNLNRLKSYYIPFL